MEGIIDDVATGSRSTSTQPRREPFDEQPPDSCQPVPNAPLRPRSLLHDIGRRGHEGAPITGDLVVHVYELCAPLAGYAARLAAERRSERWLEHAREIIDAGRRARTEDSWSRMVTIDVAFHRAVVEATDNPLLLESAEVVWRNMHRVMSQALLGDGAPAWVWDGHAAVLDAIARRDGAHAEMLARHQARHATQLILDSMATTTTDSATGSRPDRHPR